MVVRSLCLVLPLLVALATGCVRKDDDGPSDGPDATTQGDGGGLDGGQRDATGNRDGGGDTFPTAPHQ